MKYFEKYALNQHIFRAWIQPSAAKKPQIWHCHNNTSNFDESLNFSKYISYLDFSFLLAVNKNLKQNQLHCISISTSQSKIYKKLTKKRKDEVMLFD